MTDGGTRLLKFRDQFWGHGGFDELRRYIKSGGEFCKELSIIMHERAEMEVAYAKGLQKLSTKLMKASRDSIGSIGEAWQAVGAEMEHESDIHRLFSSCIAEEVVRPLRQLIETQHRIRKGVEAMVDKATRNLQDWKAASSKSKKNSFHNSRENEKVQEMSIDARLGTSKQYTEKDIIKLEKQRRKAEEAVRKSNTEYYNFCVKTERARQEWEVSVYKGSNCFQTLEEERLSSLKDLVHNYHRISKETAPKLVSATNRLDEPIISCDVTKDIQTVVRAKATGHKQSEQLLPDFYPEDSNNPMDRTRRRETLEHFLKMIQNDLDRELKGKKGVENLSKALQESPNFGTEDSQQDVNEKLQSMKAMLLFLDVTRHKIQTSLDELRGEPKSCHPFEKHIEIRKDKQGFPLTVLIVPPSFTDGSSHAGEKDVNETVSCWVERGRADGNSCQPDSDYDEFSSQGSEEDFRRTLHELVTTSELDGHQVLRTNDQDQDGTYYARPLTTTSSMGRCKALYDYDANIYDELSIRTGDVISIHEKQPDGWWVGELSGTIGIFPATYVQEID